MKDFHYFLVHYGVLPILGIAIWRWIIFFATLGLACVISRFFEIVVARKIATLKFPVGGDLTGKAIRMANPLIRWAILLLIGGHGIIFLQLNPHLSVEVVELFKVGYALLVATLFSRFIQLLLEGWSLQATDASSAQFKGSLIPALDKLARVTIYILALLLILENAGFHVGSMLAGLGIGGLAVALAAQETLANLFGSIAIFMDKPFLVGEQIQVDKYNGNVEKIGLRSTLVRQMDDTLASIPNRMLTQTGINNASRARRIQHCPTIRLAYNTSAGKMREAIQIIRDVYKAHPQIDSADVYWRDFGTTSLDIVICYWCKDTDYGKFSEAAQATNFEIKQRFEASGIELAYPTQTIYLKSEKREEPAASQAGS